MRPIYQVNGYYDGKAQMEVNERRMTMGNGRECNSITNRIHIKFFKFWEPTFSTTDYFDSLY